MDIQDCELTASTRWIEREKSLFLGHSKQYLASFLATLILLAFLFHIVLEYFDTSYQLLRKYLSTRKMFFDDIRALTRYICFDSWNQLMEFMLEKLEIPIPLLE